MVYRQAICLLFFQQQFADSDVVPFRIPLGAGTFLNG
jgi:hypothetical protein